MFTKMFSWMIFFDIESNVMSFIKKKIKKLKDFKNYKLRYTMKYGFFINSFIHLN
jgi:hypothetical protein